MTHPRRCDTNPGGERLAFVGIGVVVAAADRCRAAAGPCDAKLTPTGSEAKIACAVLGRAAVEIRCASGRVSGVAPRGRAEHRHASIEASASVQTALLAGRAKGSSAS